MSRTIKFRAWDKEEEEMYTDCSNFRGDKESNIAIQLDGTIVRESHEDFYPSIDYELWFGSKAKYDDFIELMQFTGLLDKNGKEIYEGDVCKYFDEVCGAVEFSDGSFRLVHAMQLHRRVAEDLEIIGNIYQNPELIK